MTDTHGSPKIKPRVKPLKAQPAKAAPANKLTGLTKAQRMKMMLAAKRQRERQRGH
jgi:hypothetical protein